jgi:hypothetical protein
MIKNCSQGNKKVIYLQAREAFMDEKLFYVDQHASDLGFKDPVAAYMESYVSDFLKISDCIISPIFMGEYGFLKEFMSLLLYLCYYSLISDIDENFQLGSYLSGSGGSFFSPSLL